MKILFISHEYPPIGGGGSNACYNLAKEMCLLGHGVDVVTARYQDLPFFESIEGVNIYRVKAVRKSRDKSSFTEMLSFLLGGYRKSCELAANEKYDRVVVFFGIPSGPIGLSLKRKYGLPYVIRFGGGDIPGAQKRFAFVYSVLSPYIRAIWKNADHLIANSEVLKNRAQQFEKRYPISTIPNGVDTNRFFRRTQYEADNDIRMLFVSRLIEGKGLQYVIPRMQEINDKVGRKVSLTIVGDGPYRQNLEALAEKSINVTFLGRKEGEKLIECYDEANLFILPSLSEGMPNVVLEAMAMGLPIAMTDCGGSKELIDGNGIVAPIERFVDELIVMAQGQESFYRYSEISLKRATEEFSWIQTAREYEKILMKKENG